MEGLRIWNEKLKDKREGSHSLDFSNAQKYENGG